MAHLDGEWIVGTEPELRDSVVLSALAPAVFGRRAWRVFGGFSPIVAGLLAGIVVGGAMRFVPGFGGILLPTALIAGWVGGEGLHAASRHRVLLLRSTSTLDEWRVASIPDMEILLVVMETWRRIRFAYSTSFVAALVVVHFSSGRLIEACTFVPFLLFFMRSTPGPAAGLGSVGRMFLPEFTYDYRLRHSPGFKAANAFGVIFAGVVALVYASVSGAIIIAILVLIAKTLALRYLLTMPPASEEDDPEVWARSPEEFYARCLSGGGGMKFEG